MWKKDSRLQVMKVLMIRRCSFQGVGWRMIRILGMSKRSELYTGVVRDGFMDTEGN